MSRVLLSAMLLAACNLARWNAATAVVFTFLLGLILICIALVAALIETSRSFASLHEEVSRR